MRLIRLNIVAADTCGGLLDGLDLNFRNIFDPVSSFDPLCLIGPNGAGKSQFLQLIAEIFQSIFHAIVPDEERSEGNPEILFELEYLMSVNGADCHIKATRLKDDSGRTSLDLYELTDGDEVKCDLKSHRAKEILPSLIVGYSSGDNETLSLPFLISRSGYAKDVADMANGKSNKTFLPETRLMLIDYGTHLEVLVANLLLGENKHQTEILSHARVTHLHSFRCVIQLAHSAVPKHPRRKGEPPPLRKGIQLTDELEQYLKSLEKCATCFSFNEDTETYIFDFFVNEATIRAFKEHWKSALDLYTALHKLAMLNDLAIPKKTRVRFSKDTKARRFASRLPEPQDEDKVFRFERVRFRSEKTGSIVDYVSLSDGEHQLAQLLGTFSMIAFPGVLFLLDEPESHFNPRWRVKFLSQLLDLPTAQGKRRDDSHAAKQDCLLTTHAPFVPSDLSREKVLLFRRKSDFGKIEVAPPDIETFGANFDAILSECFDVSPPISQESRSKIDELMESTDAEYIKHEMVNLGSSVEKVLLADRLRQIAVEKTGK
ncbi:restriction system-associated AAA family ATPase [Pseudoduganella namucuonensis]|uniref:Restriction system-associated AAA family ATPase n=1 Tax=Pseudoduganella namucuonensis TaxID=1035707 RepID=A0A1I7M3S7_9BURK|nr:restriction system-associated AAA family ATPase [Pseudoduganella namucuonensis]SFV16553.1 restriction system-associated AAA family ATPase [Pseudoduganella namucuonensis]